jgi:hypothetical protein
MAARKLVKEMLRGGVGYTIPWAVFRDDIGLYWIAGECNFRDDRGGTATIRVWRDMDGLFHILPGEEEDERLIQEGRPPKGWSPICVIVS